MCVCIAYIYIDRYIDKEIQIETGALLDKKKKICVCYEGFTKKRKRNSATYIYLCGTARRRSLPARRQRRERLVVRRICIYIYIYICV